MIQGYAQHMPLGTPKAALRVVVLVVVAGIATCMIAAVSLVPAMLAPLDAWQVLAVSSIMLVGALIALWVIQRDRDRTLR